MKMSEKVSRKYPTTLVPLAPLRGEGSGDRGDRACKSDMHFAAFPHDEPCHPQPFFSAKPGEKRAGISVKSNQRSLVHGVIVALATLCLAAGSLLAERPTIQDASRIETDLRADIEFLASDDLRGRGVSDETIHQAADYIAARMSEIGLDTSHFDGEPFQGVKIAVGARAGEAKNNTASFQFVAPASGDRPPPINVSLGEGMNPLAVGADAGTVQGRVAFVGFGITAAKLREDLAYDDYAGIDVKGATVILLRKEPGHNDPNSPFDGTKTTRHAFFATKIKNAIDHGAAGVIIVNDPESILKGVQNERSKIAQEETRKKRIAEELKRLPPDARNSRASFEQKAASADRMIESLQVALQQAQRGVLDVGDAGERTIKKSIPVLSLARDTADELIQQATGQSLEAVERGINENTKPNSFVLPKLQASWRIELKPSIADSNNVVGVLPGRGQLAEETIVVGAHYDHVGMGGYGSLAPGTIAVHNGADDNASGTATMLAAARTLVDLMQDYPSHRRIVFVAFTGEERGLIGSKQYVDDPCFPLESTAAMVNLDMVGRLRDNELTLYGTGSADALDEIIDRSNARYQFKLFKVKTGYGPSDHQSFYKAGIPILFFFTGLHNDYHRPTDDADKIDFAGTARITEMVADVALRLAVRAERPKYAETENKVRIRRQLTAYIGVSLSDRGAHVVLSGVNEGGPADVGGLKAGDQLELMGKQKIRTSAEVLEVLRNRSPGQSMKIRVVRDGRPLDVNVTLGVRPK